MKTMTDFSFSAKRSRELTTLPNVFYDIVKSNTLSDSKKSTHISYGKSAEKCNCLQTECQAIWKILKINHEFPKLPILPVAGDEQFAKDRANSQLWAWCNFLAKKFNHPHIGNITDYKNDSCTFTFYEFEQDKLAILNRDFKVVEHTHDLVKMRIKKNLENITLPDEAKNILNSLNLLRPYARVVTGELVTKKEKVSGQTRHRTAFGKLVDTAGKAVERASSTAGSISRSVSRTFARAKDRLSEAVTQSDPALIIADRVFVAWE